MSTAAANWKRCTGSGCGSGSGWVSGAGSGGARRVVQCDRLGHGDGLVRDRLDLDLVRDRRDLTSSATGATLDLVSNRLDDVRRPARASFHLVERGRVAVVRSDREDVGGAPRR